MSALPSTHPLDYECPTCHALSGERCTTRQGNKAKTYHRDRVRRAKDSWHTCPACGHDVAPKRRSS